LAVIQHFLWNAGTLLIAMMQGRETTLLSIVPIGVALFLLPALAVLLVIAHLATNREEKIIREQLADEVALGVLTPAEYAIVADSRLRRAALRTASQAGGRSLRSRQQRFFQIAAELAFRKHHLSRGERPKPGQRAPEDAYREELATLRSALPMSRLVTEGGTE
jgi:hypothetical protein